MSLKREPGFEAFLNRALVRTVNRQTPPGFEQRILSELERRKARHRRKTVQAACALLAAVVWGIAFFHPLDHPRSGGASAPVMSLQDSAALSTSSEETLRPAPVPVKQRRLPQENAAVDLPKEGLIEDLEIKPLKMAALNLSSLSSTR